MSTGSDSKTSVLRAAGAMSIATFLSRILGLVREQVFAVLFGASSANDAFQIAFRIPNLLRDLFAEGAMSAALVPVFTRVRKEEGDRRAWQVAGRVFRVLFVMVTVISGVGIIFAPELVRLYAGAFDSVPGKFELTVELTRLLFPFFPMVALAAAFMGILNACGKFFIPAFSSALFNLTSIAVGVVLAVFFPEQLAALGYPPIAAMAIGVLAGGFVQAISQLPSLRQVGYAYPAREVTDPAFKHDPRLKQMLWMMIPGTVGLAATQVNVLINSVLATSQGTGAVSWLNYAFRLMQFPIGIFGVSFAAATLPQVSRLFVEKRTADISETLSRSLSQVFAVNLAASAGLAFLGVPIISLLFEYGSFTHQDSINTAQALMAYSIGLTAYSAVKVLVPACYALELTRMAVLSSVLSVAVTIGANLLLIDRLGFVGLALGTSLAAVFNAFFLLAMVHTKLKSLGFAPGITPLKILGRFLIHVAVSLVVGIGAWQAVAFFDAEISSSRLVQVAIGVFVGVVIWLGLGKVLRISEIKVVFELFSSRIKRKLKV